AIPVKAQIAGGASSVTLVLWGTIGCHAWLEAYDKDDNLLSRAALPETVPRRKSPSEPIPSFELTAKGDNIAYILFGGAMEGAGRIEEQDKIVDERFQVLEAVDAPNLQRSKGMWYAAVPPLCRAHTGICPADYFGRALVANLPKDIRVGVVNVSVAGCKIE